MARKRAGDKKPAQAKVTTKEPTAAAPPAPTPIQRPASPEEQTQMQLAQQRARAEVAVLKQRFAETDVAMTIAQAERDQLIQQNQAIQQENDRLRGELTALAAGGDGKADNPSTESEDDQTTPADAASKSED